MEDSVSEGVQESCPGRNGNLAGLVPGPSFSTLIPYCSLQNTHLKKFVDPEMSRGAGSAIKEPDNKSQAIHG